MPPSMSFASTLYIPGSLRGSTEPEQPPSTPLTAAVDTWFRRRGPEGRWVVEERGVRAQLSRGSYANTPGAQWWPLPSELRACCLPFETKLRRATSWPMTEALFRHCRSFEHIAALHNVSAKELRDTVRARRLAAALACREDDVPF
mgnify:FL=1